MEKAGTKLKNTVSKAQRDNEKKKPSGKGAKLQTYRDTEVQRHGGAQVVILFLFSLVTVCCFLFRIVDAADERHDVAERIEESYSTIRDVRGVFSQTSYLKDLDRTERYSGDFYLKRPSRLRWRYRAPRDEEALLSGDDIWIIRSSEKQVVKSSFSREIYSRVPLAMIENLGNLMSDFDITEVSGDTLELLPKERVGVLKKLVLVTGPGAFPVASLAILDIYGNSNIIELKDITVNQGLEDELFLFQMPPGAELFDFTRQEP